MATTNAPTAAQQQQVTAIDGVTTDDLTTKALYKRYEGLLTVRTKAVKGKGAWYWTHLEPILVRNTDTGLPKAVKLRCSLCDAVFSASNPSRTASEHLKRGTCPNFNSVTPISTINPSPSSSSSSPLAQSSHSHHRKRNSSGAVTTAVPSRINPPPRQPIGSSYQVTPVTVVDPSRFCGGELQYSTSTGVLGPHLMLSGGKDDLGPLAMLEDSVKKLKSPKMSQTQSLGRSQIESALDYLSDWVFESCGSVSLSGLEHPKFRAFLAQVGLPIISKRDFATTRLDVKYEDARAEAESRIRDAMFLQIASDGWKSGESGGNLVNLIVNLPNGTSLYRRAVLVNGAVPSNYAEELLLETVKSICGNSPQRCVGIVSDKFKTKALRDIEIQHQWMVNLSCQFQELNSLIKDFVKELPVFKSVAQNCLRLAKLINNSAQLRNAHCKYQLQEHGESIMLRLPVHCYYNDERRSSSCYSKACYFEPLYNLFEDVLISARAIQLVMHDDACKAVLMEEHMSREVREMVGDKGFWNEVEAVHSLIKLVKEMARRIEEEKLLVGQCLPLWDELRAKIKEWDSKFNVEEGLVKKLVERRFKKSYHPAWAAAFILDPLYLIRDSSGKYLPPFKFLSPEQEKDVDKLITRLVYRDEAHIALMELMKWRTEGLDPMYAQAVQMKKRDPVSGKMRIANPQSSRLVWETYLSEFRSLGKVAVRLIFLHATSCGFKCNSSLLKWVNSHRRSYSAIDRAQKLIFISANSKFERRDFSNEEDRDAELLAMANGDDNLLNDVLVDTSSV